MRLGSTASHADGFTKENGNGERKRSLGCARDDETRVGTSHIVFQPTAEVGFLFCGEAASFLPSPWGKAMLSLCHHPQPALPLRGQTKEAQEASCASLIGMHFPAEIRCIHCLMSFRIAAEGKTALPEVFLFADIAFDRPAIEESADIEE